MRKMLQIKMSTRLVLKGASLLAISCSLAATNKAGADALTPGNFAIPVPESLTGETLVADTGVLPFTAPRETGTYEARVFEESSGTLDFVYDFSNSGSSLDALRSATMASFAGTSITDVAFDFNSGGVVPDVANLESTGTVPKFLFSVPPGSSTASLILRTNATSFDANGAYSVQDGGAANLTGFEPVAVPIPAPLTASASILALFGIAQWFRTRVAL